MMRCFPSYAEGKTFNTVVFFPEIIQSGPPEAAMLQYVMHLLAVEDIEGLPPGGGISAK